MNKVIDKGFRSCRFVSTIVKHPVLQFYRPPVCRRFVRVSQSFSIVPAESWLLQRPKCTLTDS